MAAPAVHHGASGSYCLTEPSAGSDAAALATRAVREGDDYVLNGQKQFISGAGAGDLYVVMARTGGSGAAGISTFVVPGDSAGISLGANERKMGWNAQPTRAVVFENVRVPVANRLGAEGIGFKIAMAGLDGGRLNIAACSLGGAQSALEKALAYMKERRAFGKRLDEFQALQFRLADMATGLEASRTFLWRAAAALDAKEANATQLCAMAKRFVTDTCFDIANQALQLHGGYGYLAEFGIEKIVRDLRVHQILEGTNEIMRAHRGEKPRRSDERNLLQDGDVLVREERALRRLTLNRPKALNALTLDMAVTMTALLRAWAGDPKVGAVLIDGAGERGLCAGGDIRALYDAAKSKSDLPARFWSSEYHLDVLIARYPKPVIAVMDGVVMGGGVGLSAHAAHPYRDRALSDRHAGGRDRILSRRRHLLSAGARARIRRHSPGTDRDRLGAADAIYCGLADIHVPQRILRATRGARRLPHRRQCAGEAQGKVRHPAARPDGCGAAMDRRLLRRQ